jgi:hypothetical protein
MLGLQLRECLLTHQHTQTARNIIDPHWDRFYPRLLAAQLGARGAAHWGGKSFGAR